MQNGKPDGALSPARTQHEIHEKIKWLPPTKHDEYPGKIVDAYHSIGQQGWEYITRQLLADDDTMATKIEAILRDKKKKKELEQQKKKLADSKEAAK